LEVITPVSIGSGELLSQFSDYVYDSGNVYYLDHDSLFRALSEQPMGDELIDSFLSVVFAQAGGNMANRFNLKGFLQDAGLDYKEYAVKKIPVSEEVKEQLHLHIKTGGMPYIPGSTLKGAIRTALISHLFSVEDEAVVMQQCQKQGYIGQNYFGSYGDDLLKNLLVSDTEPFQEQDLGIVKFNKYNLAKGKEQLTLVKEVINRGSFSSFTIKTTARKNRLAAKLWFLGEGHEEDLLPIINEYSRNNLALELKSLRRGLQNEVADLIEFCSQLLQSIENANPTKEAYLRIGFGKTYYDNTIAQKLSKESVRQIISKHFPKAAPGFFPKTRTVIMTQGRKEMPGWVRIIRG